MAEMIRLKGGDVVMVTDRSWLSWLIKLFTGDPGEKPKRIAHVAIVTWGGMATEAQVVEAAPTGIISRPLRDHAGRPCIVYRKIVTDGTQSPPPTAITRAKRSIFSVPKVAVDRARLMTGNRYPWWRLVAHVLDFVLLDLYLFRSFLQSSAQMESSYLVAWAYGSKITERPSWAVTPDDLDEWMGMNPDVWEVVHPFGLLSINADLGLRRG